MSGSIDVTLDKPDQGGKRPIQEQSAPPKPTPVAKPVPPASLSLMSGATNGMTDRLAQDRAAIDAREPSFPALRKPPPAQPPSDPFQAFGQPAMYIALLGSLFTRRPFVNAIQAMGGVMQATQQLDAKAAQQHLETWKLENENALKMAQFQQKAYEDAIRKLDVDTKAGKAELETHILAFKDQVLQQAMDHGGVAEVKSLLYARAKQASAAGTAAPATAKMLTGQVDMVANMQSDDPKKQAAGLEAYMKQYVADQGGKGSTAAGRQQTLTASVQLQAAINDLKSDDPERQARGHQMASGIIGMGLGALKPPTASSLKWEPFTDPTTGEQGRTRVVNGKPEYQDLAGNPIDAPKGLAKIGSASPPTITREDAHTLAQAADAGDYQVLTGLARNSANIGLVDEELGKIIRARGGSGADLAEASARFHAATASQTSIARAASRIDIGAQELSQTIPQASEASKAVVRWGVVPVDKLRQALGGATDDPDLADFALANQAVANSFAQVMTRGGQPTEGARQHAYDLLSAARSDEVYQRQLQRLEKEAQAALAGTAKASTDAQAAFKAGMKPDLTKSQQQKAPTPDPNALPDGTEVQQGGVTYRKQGSQWVPVQ